MLLAFVCAPCFVIVVGTSLLEWLGICFSFRNFRGFFLEFILAASLEIGVENSVWPAGAGEGLSHLEGWGISVQERH